MKTLFALISTITFGNIYSQEKTKTEEETIVRLTCEKGIEDAKIQAEKGAYKYLSYEVVFDLKLSNFIEEYREKKYGIKTRLGGCNRSEYEQCFYKTMNEMVLKKFGSDIFERSKKEAEKLYAKK